MKEKTFENLTRGEIKKAEAIANKHFGRKDCKVTGYSAKCSSVDGFWDVQCEICFNYEKKS